MFRLTREVRFAINGPEDPQWSESPTNTYGGYPSVTGLAAHLSLRVTLRGLLNPKSQYLINIKKVDNVARDTLRDLIPQIQTRSVEWLLSHLFTEFDTHFMEPFESVELQLSPTLSYEMTYREIYVRPVMRLSQKFEFSACHRLHNPSLGDEENRKTFGKCNNPLGHGHNYEVQVTLKGTPDSTGLIIHVPEFERAVKEAVIDRFDHKNLNVEVPEFRELIPTVENIAMTIYRILKPKLSSKQSSLASVTVWETPKTWCEYSE